MGQNPNPIKVQKPMKFGNSTSFRFSSLAPIPISRRLLPQPRDSLLPFPIWKLCLFSAFSTRSNSHLSPPVATAKAQSLIIPSQVQDTCDSPDRGGRIHSQRKSKAKDAPKT
ncbi:putative catalytic [Corchorus olitorius]|uniref:Catalytic n=1 Tax=Corchorus olitorius TaxID=93759 RepID=A0A1R3H9U6_9ROSI|nr:putative catalytic [Corchorus olitorius]